MSNNIGFDIPLVSIVYKRLDKTRKVYERIREIQPQKLYIIADGPRGEKDALQVAEVRDFIDHYIDWPCEVHKRYAKKNIGLRNGVPSGLDWVFETEERAVILEDDVVPEKIFFEYCRQMLEYYENDERVMLISGFNLFEKDELFGEEDITFSRFSSIWGWATWKRAWKKYDYNIPDWKKIRSKKDFKKFLTKDAYNNFLLIFDDLQYHWYNSWGYQWQFTIFKENAVGIVPKYNMISNIGINDIAGEHFGDTKERENLICKRKIFRYEANYKFKRNSNIFPNKNYDKMYQDITFDRVSQLRLIKNNIRAKTHVICRKIIRMLERDEKYFDTILPENYKLSEREREWNLGDKYKQISAEELRFSAFAYLFYKLLHKDLYKSK